MGYNKVFDVDLSVDTVLQPPYSTGCAEASSAMVANYLNGTSMNYLLS